MPDERTEPLAGDHVVEIVEPAGTRRIVVRGVIEIGRERGDVLIPDGTVSSRHLRLDGSGRRLVATDLGSTNGTRHGSTRISTPTPVDVGDELVLGDVVIRIVEAPEPMPAGPRSPSVAAATPTDAVRTDAVEVRYTPGTFGATIARRYAAAATTARKTLAGFGGEQWGTVPVVNLIDPYHDGTEVIASGAIVQAATNEAWVVVSPEAPPEPPHRLLALIFGAAFPAAEEVQPLIEGFGLHRSGAPDPADTLGNRTLPTFDEADGETRGAMTVSFVRFLLEREGEDGLVRLLAARPGRVDETAREVYGPSLTQLEQQWRQQAFSGKIAVQTGEFLRMSLRHLRPYKLRQVEIFAYMLLSLAFVAAFPFATRHLFDVALPSGELRQVLALLAVLGVSFLVSLAAGVRQAYQTAWISGAVTRDIRQAVFDRVQVLPSAWFSRHPQGDVLARLFNDVAAVQSGISQAIGQGVFQMISLVTTAVIMLGINLWLGLVVLAAAPLVGLVYRSMAAGAQRRSLQLQESSSALLSIAAENYRANPVVKMFGLAGREQRRFAQQGERVFRATRRLTLWGGLFGLSVNLIVTLLRLGVLGFGAWLILNGRFTAGGLVAFLAIMSEVLSPVTVLVGLSQEIQESMGSLVRLNEVLAATGEPDDTSEQLPPLTRELQLVGIGLSYSPERRALDGLDVTIRAGTRVAFVGPSGSGKSSVLRLLMRLYEPDDGTILIDGVGLTSGSLKSWRDQLGVVFQDSFLFDASIRENIAVGRPGATDDDVRRAAQAAEVDDFAAVLPRGLDTLVGEGGANLSGGQRQRVAIARALIRDPRLLLLDEATSALDPATERQINDTIERIGTGRTVVSVTHRLASITGYDLIVVIVDGRLAEQGRHDELLAAGGAYARLWAEQTGTPLPAPPPFDAAAALRRVPFLATVGDAALDELVGALSPFALESDRVVEEGDGLFLVVSGRGEVQTDTAGGTVVTAELHTGEAFGVSAALGAPGGAVLRARDAMELLHLSSAALGAIVARHPEIAATTGGAAPGPTPITPPATGTRLRRATLTRAAIAADPVSTR